ncbi:MAG: ABC transporter ATP-binding protein [Verrucomicrobiota bacterium]
MFEFKKFSYDYPESKSPALSCVNLTIKKGEWILLLGKSGSGKSTLGKALGNILLDYYGGRFKGNIFWENKPFSQYRDIEFRRSVGMVFQSPEKQVLTPDVLSEIVCGMENIGLPHAEMEKRLDHFSSSLGIKHLLNRKCENLSGGELQRVIIASILAMGCQTLILDEPFSQLDPNASRQLLKMLSDLKKKMGLTIILIEQQVDSLLHRVDRVLFLEEGRIIHNEIPRQFVKASLKDKTSANLCAPLVSQLIVANEPPITIEEGRDILKSLLIGPSLEKQDCEERVWVNGSLILESVNFQYSIDEKPILKDIQLELHQSELVCLLGENGAGKSTLLVGLSGLLENIRGQVLFHGEPLQSLDALYKFTKIGYLSQNPHDYLFHDTVYEELKFSLEQSTLHSMDETNVIKQMLHQLQLDGLEERDPRTLSGGEKQRLALGCVLIKKPEILLIDEPTRGLDQDLKELLGKLLRSYLDQGSSILLATQDVDFAAEYADRIALIESGKMSHLLEAKHFFKQGYYTSTVRRLFRGFSEDVYHAKSAKERLSHIKESVQ